MLHGSFRKESISFFPLNEGKTMRQHQILSRDDTMHGVGLYVGLYSKTIQMAHTRRLVVTS